MKCKVAHVLAAVGAVVCVAAAAGFADAGAAADPVALVGSLGSNYEDGWNQLLIRWLRAERGESDTARTALRRCERVAEAEPIARGTHIAADALELARRWSAIQRRSRIEAFEAESLGLAERTRDTSLAAPAYRKALALYRPLGERRRQAVATGGLGVALLTGGSVQEADQVYREALILRRAIGDSILVGNTLFDLGICAQRMRRFEQARAFFEQSGRVRAGTGEKAKQGSALSLMGSVLTDQGHLDEAVRVSRDAVGILSVAPVDSRRLAEGWANLGRAALLAGDVTTADSALARADELQASADPHVRMAVTDNLAERDRMLGRFTDALERKRQVEAMARTLEDSLLARSAIAHLYLLTGRVDLARGILEQVRAAADEVPWSAARITSRITLSQVERIDGRYDVAQLRAREALALGREAADSVTVEQCLAVLGDLALAAQRPGDAVACYERALAARAERDPEAEYSLRINAAVARIRGGDLDQAETALEAVARRTGTTELGFLHSVALLNLAHIDDLRGDWTRAVERGRTVLSFVDSIRSIQGAEEQAIAVLSNRYDEFGWYVGFLNRLDERQPGRGWGEQAFSWAERSRARSLMDRVLIARGTESQSRPSSLREVQQRLGPSDVMLYYCAGDSGSTLWAVRRDRWKRASLPPGSVLKTLVELARTSMSQNRTAGSGGSGGASRVARDDGRLQRLYDLLVAPAEPMLAGARLVIVVPDGPLHRLPFEALIRKERGRRQYLVERWAVAYAPSASWVGVETSAAPSTHAAAVGDVLFETGGAAGEPAAELGGFDDRAAPLANLPHTGEEIRVLATLLGPGALDVFRGAAASRGELLRSTDRLRTAWLLHFATHGEASELEPASSGLWLAPDSGSTAPSKLTVDDVLHLELSARQVTLSACETGLGRVERGEGVLGLARAFLAAGAQAVTVSLWKVSDSSTSQLMREFYGNALRAHMTRAEALAQAKRLFIQKGIREPFYWAPFVLIGDPGPMNPPVAVR